MKKIITAIFIAFLFISIHTSAQTFFTRSGKVMFVSKASIENIEANNNEVTSFLDTKKGEFVFAVLIKSFKFKKALMEEHFNENYMESNTFPKANFKGTITDLTKINFLKTGTYPVAVKGDLTIHGVTKTVTAAGTITILQDKINVLSKFSINLKDHNIKIPSAVINNVSETIDITVDCKYDPFKKG
jgi:polyisoprenoid-binding protein YceI